MVHNKQALDILQLLYTKLSIIIRALFLSLKYFNCNYCIDFPLDELFLKIYEFSKVINKFFFLYYKK